MAQVQSQRQCDTCGRPTLHAKEALGMGWGLLLTLLTAGLFIPIWCIIGVSHAFEPFVCQTCGSNRSAQSERGIGFVMLVLAGFVILVAIWVKYGQ